MYITLLRGLIADLVTKRDTALDSLDALAATLTTANEDGTTVARSATAEETAQVSQLQTEANAAEAERAAKQTELDGLLKIAEARAATPQPGIGAPGFIGRAGGGSDPYDFDVRTAPRTRDGQREIQERALRALEVDSYLEADDKGRIEGMLRNRKVNRQGALGRHILMTGSDEYRDAFLQLSLRSNPILTAHQADLVRATIEITADANGGYLMPFTLDPTVILTSTGTVNPVRALATVETQATDNWQGITSGGITASYDAEKTEVSDDSPTFGQPLLKIHQAQAWAEATVQANDDLDGLADSLSLMFADAKDTLELTKFTLGAGDGSNEPWGFVTEGTKVTSTTTDVYAVADVYKLQNAVNPRWQQNATWQAALPTINLTRQFGTALGHAFLTDLGGGQPPQILGQSLYQNSGMDGVINATAENYMLAYGDMKRYRIRDRIGMTVQFVPVVMGANFRPTGKVGWYVRWRNGARLDVPAAVQILNVT